MSTDDGLRLGFAPVSLVRADGQPVTGTLDIDYALFDSALSLLSAPGGLMAEAEAEAEGSEVQLVSNGMVDVHLSQGGIDVQPTAAVDLSFPVIGNEAPCGHKFELYGFDMASGLWSAEEGGRVEGERFVATVTHFSYWNADAPIHGDGCIDATLLRDGVPLAHTEVGVWLSNGTAASPTTDSLGALRVQAPPRDLLTLGIVYDAYGQTGPETADAIWSVGPVTVPVAGEGCADGGTVEVTGVDMDGDGRSVQPWGNECYDHDDRHTEPCPGAAGFVPGDSSGSAPVGDTACP